MCYIIAHIMEYNMEAELEKYAEIGRILTCKSIDDDRQAALEGIRVHQGNIKKYKYSIRLKRIFHSGAGPSIVSSEF